MHSHVEVARDSDYIHGICNYYGDGKYCGREGALTWVDGDFLSSASEVTSLGSAIHSLEVGVEGPIAMVSHGIGIVANTARVDRPTIHLPLVSQRPAHPVQGAL